MNAEQLIARFRAQGFDYLSSEECLSYLNDAYLVDICEVEDWPFLEATAKGAAPLTLEDLRTVDYVIDLTLTEKLAPLVQGRITDDWSPDLTETGTPSLYYLTKGNTVNVYPVAADELQVNYWKVPGKLSGTDEPLIPERFHTLIVDGAKARAYENGDDFELASAAEAKFAARLAQMRDSLLNPQHDEPDDYIVVEDPYALR